MERGDDVLLVSHCIGSVIAYDALWASRAAAIATAMRGRQVTLWLTLGAPLGDESVKHGSDGAREPTVARIRTTSCRGSTLPQKTTTCATTTVSQTTTTACWTRRLVSRIEDIRIYNLAVRYGRSNPHNVLGYLTHPRVSRSVGELAWRRPISHATG